MSRSYRLAALAVVTLAGSVAFAQTGKENKPAAPAAKPAAQAEHAMPEGMTEADMKACMEAGTPGEMHAHLAKGVGVWAGKTKMWMAPGAEPMTSECTTTISSIMDGRFTKCEVAGEMPGMGPFNGFGLYGFDNVAQKFQSTWIDNCGTGIMTGTGELSSDGKTMTWNFSYNCPITKKPAIMREVERYTGKDSMVLEMFNTDPKTGEEFKMMEITYTRKTGSASALPASGAK